MTYTGYQTQVFSNDQLALLYEDKLDIQLKENEYLIVTNELGEVVDKFCYQNNKLRKVNYTKLGDKDFSGRIKPRNTEQELAFDMLKDTTSTVKLITGKWGTGKTMLLCAAAIEQLNKGKFDKIVWIRNNVQVKDTDNLGALPGDALEKTLPYVMPFADHCGGVDGVKAMIENQTLEVIPLAFLRGRSIRNAIIISSEAENLTREHIQLILGRVDEGSNLWMDADLRQRDREVFSRSQGIETLVEKLSGNKLFSYVHLVKTERSETAALADLL